MKKTLLINKSFKLIQMIRVIHALSESDYSVAIPPTEIEKFSILINKFGLSFANAHDRANAIDITHQVRLSHSKPQTSIGKLSRTLIFPTIVTKYCRSIWEENRTINYSFQGLVTNERKPLIEGWLSKNILGKQIGKREIPNTNSRRYRLRKKFLSKLGLDHTIEVEIGDFLLWSSDRGRRFPIKAWDDKYFKVLANSKFVLCPGGDYIWSYRFFEAILCGAIPIVERSCEAYEGFRFFTFEDNAKELKWRLDDVEFNYALCLEKLTIPQNELNGAIAAIIQGSV